MSELKPCPFCGDNQQLNYVELSNGLHYIECERCGAAPHRLGAWNRETAVKYWNSVNRWIPCSERLPEYGEYVMFIRKNCECYIGYYDEKNTWNTDYQWFTGEDVTHWMPLPEPPEGGADHA
jgi:hypothetical protein